MLRIPRLILFFGALLFANCLFIGCGGGSGPKPPEVLEIQQAVIDEAGGTIQSMTIPEAPIVEFGTNALSGEATVELKVLDKPPSSPANTQAQMIGYPVQLAITGATITEGAQVTLRVNGSVEGEGRPVVAYEIDGLWFANLGAINDGVIAGNLILPLDDEEAMIRTGLGAAPTTMGVFILPTTETRFLPTIATYKFDQDRWNSYSGTWTGTRVALLVHGLPTEANGNAREGLLPLARFLKNELSYTVYGIEYPKGYVIDATGVKLAELIRTRVPAEAKIDILAHSMGGVVARSAIENNIGVEEKVSKLVTMSSPHIGVTAAFLSSLALNVSGYNPEFFDLEVDSSFYQRLNNGQRTTCHYFSAVGTDSRRPTRYTGLGWRQRLQVLLMKPHDGLVEEISSGTLLGSESASFEKREFTLNHDAICLNHTLVDSEMNRLKDTLREWLGGISISVTVVPASLVLFTGTQQQFDATVIGTINPTVVWNTDGGSVDINGLYTAPEIPGTYYVTATSAADPSKSDTAEVTVVEPGGIGVIIE